MLPKKNTKKVSDHLHNIFPQDTSHGIDKLFRTKEQLLLSSRLNNVISQDMSNGVVDGCICPL
jgi:hypothetical protein